MTKVKVNRQCVTSYKIINCDNILSIAFIYRNKFLPNFICTFKIVNPGKVAPMIRKESNIKIGEKSKGRQ